MFDRAVANTAIRYGVTGGIVSFLYMAILALLGFENPYDDPSEFSSTLVFVSVFVFLAIKYFKKFNDEALGFGRAFKVGFATTFYLAFTTAVLMCIFSFFVGAELIQQYIVAKQAEMQLNREVVVQVMGQVNYERGLNGLQELNAFDLAKRTFVYRIILGIIISLVLAIFFRK
ncbi:DUF4199 domain-containing protein [Rufibacter sp. LB8]|uniref:DUF4199 domain-containing protein n=1 Tax=Rufibacter sp. LB8 TaxID=2777781 RepID=UPI00178C30D5|nr:DUF4199 domain-containing protein [Rufibacter sp. LB8]